MPLTNHNPALAEISRLKTTASDNSINTHGRSHITNNGIHAVD